MDVEQEREMPSFLSSVIVAAVIATVAATAGCNHTDPLFCCTTEASCSAAGEVDLFPCTDSSRPYCDDLGEYGTGRHCIADPLSGTCAGPADCTAERPICLDEACVECAENGDCGDDQPVCGAGHLCEACGSDDDCQDRASAPRCFVADGACVACVDSATDCTSATAPVCDEDTHACRSCGADGECPSNVCSTGTGECLAEANVIYLAPGGAAGTCTQAAPCATFAQGLSQVAGSRNVIKAAAGTYGEFTVNNLAVTILGTGAIVQTGLNDQDLVTVTNGANVTIAGLTIRNAGGTGRGVVCGTGAVSTVVLQGATVSGNAAGGVSATNCTVSVESSTVSGNAGGGVSLSGGNFTLVNNWIVENGGSATVFGGVQVANITAAGTHAIDFNTIYNNNSNDAFPGGISCPTVTITNTFSNNIVFMNESTNQVGGANCAFTYSDIGPAAAAGTGNINMAPLFVDAINRDYHLQPTSPGIDDADPAATLAVDIDGDARPQGTGRDMGADEVVP